MLNSAYRAECGALIATHLVPCEHPMLDGHFPQLRIWPGCLLVEAMAQAAALHFISSRGYPLASDELPVLGAIDTRLLSPVWPGDLIHIEVRLIRAIEQSALFSAQANRLGQRVARARISAGISKLKDLSMCRPTLLNTH